VLMVVATLLHPSRETATTIIASEPRLVADTHHRPLAPRGPRHHRRIRRGPAARHRRPDPAQGHLRPRQPLHRPLEALATTSSRDLGL
jgi:hypothetical protein